MVRSRWVRLDVDYFGHPRARAAGVDGRALHLASICWVGQQLSDGHIPVAVVQHLLNLADVNRRAVDRIVTAGLWLPTAGEDFYVKDYLDRNPSRGDVERERERWRQRQRRYRSGECRDDDGRFTPETDP